jgi:hypothetical protein
MHFCFVLLVVCCMLSRFSCSSRYSILFFPLSHRLYDSFHSIAEISTLYFGPGSCVSTDMGFGSMTNLGPTSWEEASTCVAVTH